MILSIYFLFKIEHNISFIQEILELNIQNFINKNVIKKEYVLRPIACSLIKIKI